MGWVLRHGVGCLFTFSFLMVSQMSRSAIDDMEQIINRIRCISTANAVAVHVCQRVFMLNFVDNTEAHNSHSHLIF